MSMEQPHPLCLLECCKLLVSSMFSAHQVKPELLLADCVRWPVTELSSFPAVKVS